MCEYGLGLGDWLKRGVVVPLGGCTHVRVRPFLTGPHFLQSYSPQTGME